MTPAAAVEAVHAALEASGLEFERSDEQSFAVTLPGTHKLQTVCGLVVGDHALLVEAFVIRKPDENRETFYRWLLERNTKTFGVHFALDHLGDVYLVGRLPFVAVTPDEIDRLLGAVLTYADESFNRLLELGFRSSIRREWEWRVKRGESLANLQAFRHLVEEDAEERGAGPAPETKGGD